MIHHTLFAATASLGLLSMSGCAENPADSKPRASVEDVSTQSEACNTKIPDGAKSLAGDIIFTGSKVTGKHVNRFSNWVGSAVVDSKDITQTKLSFCVITKDIIGDIDQANPGNPKFEKKLRSVDFFDVEKYPTSTFKSTTITANANAEGTHTVTGNLTIRDITKAITFPATLSSKDGVFDFAAEFSINRKDFNITYKGKQDDLIRDEVLLKLQFKSN